MQGAAGIGVHVNYRFSHAEILGDEPKIVRQEIILQPPAVRKHECRPQICVSLEKPTIDRPAPADRLRRVTLGRLGLLECINVRLILTPIVDAQSEKQQDNEDGAQKQQ